MFRPNFVLYLLLIVSFFSMTACSDGGSKKSDPKGTLSIMVTDGETTTALGDVRVLVFDANTNLPAGDALMTDADGMASDKYAPGTYYVKLSKQNYLASPAPGVSALPLTVTKGQTSATEVVLFATGDTSPGSISGRVTDGSHPVAGVLVVATNTGDSVAFSSITDESGEYAIYNAPAATYTVKAWNAGYHSDEADATVVQSTVTPDVDITLTAGVSGSVSGAITFLATNNGEVDVSLIHPITGDVIPGTTTRTSGGLYTISDVADGDYIARATFENDSYVVDPDAIVKFGEPTVSVAGVAADRPFDVTGAVTLTSPTNTATDTSPVAVDTLTPTFTWVAYPSTSDYVVEVTNASGNVIWGGFSNAGADKNIIIPSAELSVVYNSDGLASEDLVDGKTYRWRVYASKDAGGNSGNWNLISASEDQMGIFRVVLPTAP